jgi:transcription-repair coupling factor (superfamily II helicase)
MAAQLWSQLATDLRATRIYRDLCRLQGRAERLPVAASAWVFGLLAEDLGRPLLVIVPHEAQALDFMRGGRLAGVEVEQFSAPSLTPYQATPASLRVRAQEVVALDRISRGQVPLLVTTPRALFRPLPSRSAFEASVLDLAPGDELAPEDLAFRLEALGYDRRDLVSEVGEFAIRGGVADCFPVGSQLPIRLDYFGDEIETLRSFDPGDQRSCGELKAARIPPLTLFSGPSDLERLGEALRGEELGYEAARQVEAAIEGTAFPGWENYLPMLADEWLTLSDWLGVDAATVVIEPQTVVAEIDRHAADLEADFSVRNEAGQLAAPPERLEHSRSKVLEVVENQTIVVDSVGAPGEHVIDFAATLTDQLSDQLPRFPAEVEAARSRGERVLVVVESDDHRARTERLCEHYSLPVGQGGVEIVEGRLDRGFRLPVLKLALYSESQLFRRPPTVRRSRPAYGPFLSGLRDLRVGDYLVHQDHGIGQFDGLRTVGNEEADRKGLPPILEPELDDRSAGEVEVMEIRYANGQVLLLPPSRLDLIQRYGGAEGVSPRLDRLGGTSWARAKERVRSGVRALAVDLLKLYAQRQLSEAPQLEGDTDLQRQFEAAFSYEPTADQVEAIGEIKVDLESDRPMDRLLCGDVGFGKTEVAMRAAFKIVEGGFQVVVLAPTTILADQHYETFCERFAGFPVEIDIVSRFRSPAQIKQTRERIAEGRVDILVGTHRVLSKDIRLPRLGLLIVDEEQRFGVAQKERLKELKQNVHVLALSATPVPRTLQLSLAGVRDLSTIETPPRDRLAIETAIVPHSPDLIREAVEYELDRGGQVYYVYNRVAGISEMAARLRKICPNVRLVVGHGQLEEGELSRRMHAFKAGEHDLLLATTIIENGIDIPNVNTMIVHDADRFGLAQLYQLRGRVGRSNQLAYCYLLVPEGRVLTETSRRRLEAIKEFSELGAGFRVAARDLEIRGAGDFLGAEQSGHISTVGMETYLKLLDEAVRELKGQPVEEAVSAAINLPVSAAIPEEYIGDTNLRMEMYRRVAAGHEASGELESELEDRFGPLPDAVRELIGMAALRHRAEDLRIQSITGRARRLKVRFRHDTLVQAETLIRFVGQDPDASFTPSGVLTVEGVDPGNWVTSARELLKRLSI